MQVSAQGLEQRFTAAAVAFMRGRLEAGMEQLVNSETGRTLLPQFKGVYLTDCTRLVWGKAGVKLGVRWELQHGQLRASLSEIKAHDQKAAVVATPLPTGSLHLGDLGFYNLKQFAQWNAQGVYWLTRFKVGTTVYTPAGEPLDLLTFLGTVPLPVNLPVRVGVKQHVAAYLVVAATPDDAYHQRLARLQEQARLDQRPISLRQAAYAGWTIYLTNYPHFDLCPGASAGA